LVLLRR